MVDHDRNPATPAIAALVITARAGAYSITAQAWPTDYRWEIQPKTQPGTRAGRDRATLTSRQAGSREQPAARYRFQTKGLYSITEATNWTGTYTWHARWLARASPASGAVGDGGAVPRRAEPPPFAPPSQSRHTLRRGVPPKAGNGGGCPRAT